MYCQFSPSQESTVLALAFKSRGRADQLVQMRKSGEIRMRHTLRLPITTHHQVSKIIEQLRLRLERMNLPSVVGIDMHHSAGAQGYHVYSEPLPQIAKQSSYEIGHQTASDPLRFILRLGRRLYAASQHKLFHQTLSPQAVYLYGEGRFLLFGLGAPALGSAPSVFSAPEIAETRRMDEAATVYALGMMLFAQYGGSFILGGQDPIRTHNRPYLEDQTLELHAATKELIARCTAHDPQRRIPNLQAFCNAASDTIQQQVGFAQRFEVNVSTLKKRVTRALQPAQQRSSPITSAHLIPIHSFENRG